MNWEKTFDIEYIKVTDILRKQPIGVIEAVRYKTFMNASSDERKTTNLNHYPKKAPKRPQNSQKFSKKNSKKKAKNSYPCPQNPSKGPSNPSNQPQNPQYHTP